MFFLLSAGNETTANLVANGLTLLIDHPDAYRRILEDPDRVPTAVEEMLRYDPPLHLAFRRTMRPTRLGDKAIPADAIIYEVLPAANRDPRQFTDASVFDIARSSNRQLAFNHGVHFCVGHR